EIHLGTVLSLDQADLQVPHEPTGGEPEIVSHQDNCLDVLAVAMSKTSDQFRVLLASIRMKPLLKMVEDKEHLPPRRQNATSSQACQRINEPQFLREQRTR